MPVYEYQCPECKVMLEQLEKMNIPSNPPVCNVCSVKMEKQISLGRFELKGKGWFKDGY